MYIIGNLIRETREKLGYTQDQPGEIVGCNGTSISRYEKGTHLPERTRLKKILEAFKTPYHLVRKIFSPNDIDNRLGDCMILENTQWRRRCL